VARFLLMTSAEKGHLNPVAGVAQWLLREGHAVGWMTVPEPAAQLESLRVDVVAMEGAPEPPALVSGGEELARLVLDPPALRRWIRTLLVEAVPAQVEPVRRAIRAYRPDLVALDGMLYQAVIASHLEGVGYAGISSALTLLEPPELDIELLRTVRALAPERAALFARYGLEPDFRTCECLSPLLNVVFATEALVGVDAAVPPRTVLVGPSLPPEARGDEPGFPWERIDDGRPLVYVSFGSQIYWQPELFALVAEAAAPLGVQLVVSAGELAERGLGERLPGRVIAVPYAPQLQILARARAAVSHGGANSVMEAMAHGVPMLLIPICNDQPVQAHFLAKAGTGLSLDRRGVTVEALRRALIAILDEDGEPRRRAAAVGESYRRRDGARETARHLATLVA
jgi:MGT family glycosyltransferase